MHPAPPCPGTQLDEDTATELEDAVDDGLTKKIAESSQFKPKGCESQGGGGGGKGISICSAHVEETELEDSLERVVGQLGLVGQLPELAGQAEHRADACGKLD